MSSTKSCELGYSSPLVLKHGKGDLGGIDTILKTIARTSAPVELLPVYGYQLLLVWGCAGGEGTFWWLDIVWSTGECVATIGQSGASDPPPKRTYDRIGTWPGGIL